MGSLTDMVGPVNLSTHVAFAVKGNHSNDVFYDVAGARDTIVSRVEPTANMSVSVLSAQCRRSRTNSGVYHRTLLAGALHRAL